MKTQRQSIQLLEEHIIDQIKAGEVIERPSTLIKEVLENSIDANSKNISIEIQQNGLDLISVEDDGDGIVANDLPLAFCRHATSKIERFEDLYSLNSYGFRGEALASIASISRVSCDSRTNDGHGQLRIEGGETLMHEVTSGMQQKTGTKLYIKDLFYNTPARMKFIQSATTEKNKIKKILNAFLLTNPTVNFSIKWDMGDKDFFEAVAEDNFESRIRDSLFNRKNIEFFHNENSYDGVRVQIYLTKESSRGNAHKQNYIFVNNRYIQDVQLHKIILNSAQDLWNEGETGSYIAKITLPSDELDVNVHPNKTVIKFFKPGKILSLLSGTVKQLGAELKVRASVAQSSEQNDLIGIKEDVVKDFSYKEFDFSTPEQTQSYFDRLHGNVAPEVGKIFEIIKRFTSYCIVEHTGEVFSLSLANLTKMDLEVKAAELQSAEEIPLLVSKPIKLDHPIEKELIDSLSKIGFQCDLVTDDSLLVRSFPKPLQAYPYLSIVKDLITSGLSKSLDLRNFDFKTIGFDHFSDHFIAEIVLKSSISHLLEKSVLTPINETHLEKIHGR